MTTQRTLITHITMTEALRSYDVKIYVDNGPPVEQRVITGVKSGLEAARIVAAARARQTGYLVVERIDDHPRIDAIDSSLAALAPSDRAKRLREAARMVDHLCVECGKPLEARKRGHWDRTTGKARHSLCAIRVGL